MLFQHFELLKFEKNIISQQGKKHKRETGFITERLDEIEEKIAVGTTTYKMDQEEITPEKSQLYHHSDPILTG